MHSIDLHTPAMTVAIALAGGMAAQSVAYHLRLPGIVILLMLGVLLGPDVLGVIRPDALGDGLSVIIGFAIAVILFEGGMNLEWRRLRREAAVIRRLVTVGALVTWGGATCAAFFVMGWDWRLAILFGSLVIVTGPTVVTPLLRRIRVNRNLQTILEAEGVFIDAIGAILAVVAFEFTYGTDEPSFGRAVVHVATRVAIGATVGAIGGGLALVLHRSRRVIPHGMEKVFTLTIAWATFQASNMLAPESGITAAVVAGLVVGNIWTRDQQRLSQLRDFKEQLTVMLIGMLFVLLAASVRLDEITSLGTRGFLVVAALALVVRPLQVWLCTAGSDLTTREKAFISWISPRGIVAASVATLFYERMHATGVAGGGEMRGLVFLVIACTVVVQGITGAAVAEWLGVRRPRGRGFVILGANDLAIALGRELRVAGEEVVLVDANPELSMNAERRGFRVLNGNALDDRILQQSDLDTRKGVVALLPNGGVNLLFARRAIEENRSARVYVAMHRGAITPAHVKESRARVLCGADLDVDLWASRLRRSGASAEPWRFEGNARDASSSFPVAREARHVVLPISFARGQVVLPTDDRYEPKKGDVVAWLVFTKRVDEAHEWLTSRGWVRADI
ncbi:MAG TPA: sodium:proton antiporter [Candidatus Krumholzibacteria bacterium]|nr:sodium:proton antiporter [Candidatus Krumholzibacteria bacterium]